MKCILSGMAAGLGGLLIMACGPRDPEAAAANQKVMDDTESPAYEIRQTERYQFEKKDPQQDWR